MAVGSEKDLSIIIPVYNAVSVLPTCVNSILGQTIDLSRVEVLLVDDGSTDGSGELCDEYVKEHPGLFKVIHQPNSGGPAIPRNRGIEKARGEYVFFCDNDDRFGVEAFERMIEHAFEWDSDVLVCRCGRTSRASGFWGIFEHGNVPNVDLYDSKVFFFTTPWKCFKRSFLIDSNIHFPEDCSLDDVVFVVEAYLKANVISIAADYDYYYWEVREDGMNLSENTSSSFWYGVDRRLRGTRYCLQLMDELLDHGKDTEPFYFRIVGGSNYGTLRVLAWSKSEDAPRLLDEARKLVEPYCTESLLRRFSLRERTLYNCLLEESSFECFSAAESQSKRGLEMFSYEKGRYCCAYCVKHGMDCMACHAMVAAEAARLRLLREQPEVSLSAKDRNDLSWLAKQEAKEKMNDSFAGRFGLRLARTGVARRILRPLKRRLFK